MAKKSGKTVPSKPIQPRYKKLKLPINKRPKPAKRSKKLPNAWRLTRIATGILWQNKGLFIGITLVYGFLNAILAKGLSGGTDLSELKNALDQIATGHFGGLSSSLTIFAVLVGSAGNTSSATGGAYQLFLALIASLALIWAFRQVLAGSSVRIRDAYYRGMYPLVPFILVLLVVSLQLLPLVIGSTIYSVVIGSGLAPNLPEQLAWLLFYGFLASISLYLVSSSLFAIYIAALPDMTPMKALRSARELVRYRRWAVLRKILCLPIILLATAAVIMLPIIIWLTPLAQWVFFLLTMFSLTATHAYMYSLYRELLNE